MANEVAKKPQTGLQKFNAMLENTRTQEYLTNVLGEKKQTFAQRRTNEHPVVGNGCSNA